MNSSFSSKGATPCDNVVDLFGMTQHIHPHKKLQGKFSDWSFPESILMQNIPISPFTISIESLVFPLIAYVASYLIYVCLSFLICINGNNNNSIYLKGLF